MANLVEKFKDKIQRHKERHSALDFQYVFSDSIHFVHAEHWDAIANNKTVFLHRDYLRAIEQSSPDNTCQRYAIAYSGGVPVLVLSCQVANISGERLLRPDGAGASLISNYEERVLVCGNLVSSGLHGVAFSDEVDEETCWRIVAEILYKIRRSEKISGKIDFAIIKDIKGEQFDASKVVERYSYRKIQTDPDMVLDLGEGVESFDAYLGLLNSKYRSRVRKIIKSIDQSGFECKKIAIDCDIDDRLHALYMQVEKQSKTRLATLPKGYFLALANNLGDRFSCYAIMEGEDILGFISVIKDGGDAIAYYVGFDYQKNEEHPIYFRLLQLVIESAVAMKCQRVLFGRSALEPKANLGAMPVDTFVWARHRVPAVNFFVRKIFRNVPFDDAPERRAIKNTE